MIKMFDWRIPFQEVNFRKGNLARCFEIGFAGMSTQKKGGLVI